MLGWCLTLLVFGACLATQCSAQELAAPQRDLPANKSRSQPSPVDLWNDLFPDRSERKAGPDTNKVDTEGESTLGEMLRRSVPDGERDARRDREDDKDAKDDSAVADDADRDDELDRDAPDDESDAAERTQQIRLDQIARLRKSITDVRIAVSDARVPEEEGGLELDVPPEVLVTAIGIAINRPDRRQYGFCHRPLYYEQPNLERCGNSLGYLQNAVSGIQFLCHTATLPYQLVHRPADCAVPVGADCQTCQSYRLDINPFPIDHHALVSELAAIGGFAFLLL